MVIAFIKLVEGKSPKTKMSTFNMNLYLDLKFSVRKYCCVLIAIMGALSSFSQSLTPSVRPAGGGYGGAGNIQLQYTIGEPLINTYNVAHQNELSLGFEQPELNIDCSVTEPCYTLPFLSQTTFDTVYIYHKLFFISPGSDYSTCDSIYFNYHVINPSSGAEVVGVTPVKFSCNGLYLADNLNALTSGNSYQIEFILYNGNRYSFNLKKR